jgi:hypothetical protein
MPEAAWIALFFGDALPVLVGIHLMALLFYISREATTSGRILRAIPAQFPSVIVTMPGRHWTAHGILANNTLALARRCRRLALGEDIMWKLFVGVADVRGVHERAESACSGRPRRTLHRSGSEAFLSTMARSS